MPLQRLETLATCHIPQLHRLVKRHRRDLRTSGENDTLFTLSKCPSSVTSYSFTVLSRPDATFVSSEKTTHFHRFRMPLQRLPEDTLFRDSPLSDHQPPLISFSPSGTSMPNLQKINGIAIPHHERASPSAIGRLPLHVHRQSCHALQQLATPVLRKRHTYAADPLQHAISILHLCPPPHHAAPSSPSMRFSHSSHQHTGWFIKKEHCGIGSQLQAYIDALPLPPRDAPPFDTANNGVCHVPHLQHRQHFIRTPHMLRHFCKSPSCGSPCASRFGILQWKAQLRCV